MSNYLLSQPGQTLPLGSDLGLEGRFSSFQHILPGALLYLGVPVCALQLTEATAPLSFSESATASGLRACSPLSLTVPRCLCMAWPLAFLSLTSEHVLLI